jgi:spore maturation protein CgeB
MKVVLFYHAYSSCWNNGNAHFLRGVARELIQCGHEVVVHEPADGWSRENAVRDGGEEVLAEAGGLAPGVEIRSYSGDIDLDAALEGADLVIVHEWNAADLIAKIGARRVRGGTFTLLFHDTHHRAITAPDEMARLDLGGYDGVLAFGEVLRDLYAKRGWARRAFTWHEAADVDLFRPLRGEDHVVDLVWIGNWGDEERSAEIRDYLLRPARELRLTGDIYGVRYPSHALQAIRASGLRYAGWLPNHRVPQAFARSRATVHVPRGPYARSLPGIPTIRMFEALACGTPLVSAPWLDEEKLFPPGCYLSVAVPEGMPAALSALLLDRELAAALSEAGLRAVHDRHTCAHRVRELLSIVASIQGSCAAGKDNAMETAA